MRRPTEGTLHKASSNCSSVRVWTNREGPVLCQHTGLKNCVAFKMTYAVNRYVFSWLAAFNLAGAINTSARYFLELDYRKSVTFVKQYTVFSIGFDKYVIKKLENARARGRLLHTV